MKELADAALVAAALDGGAQDFGPIVKRYREGVFGVALARLGNFHEAEDVAQQVFVEAFERLDKLKDPARLGPWLRAATIHRCIDALRQRGDQVDIDAVQVAASSAGAPDVVLEKQELRRQVMAAIGRLGKAQRETTTLFYIGGYTIYDIAAIQGVPVGTIKRRLHDARAKLKTEMLKVVEETLKAEAPKEDFARRVFEMLCRYERPRPVWPYQQIEGEMRQIGLRGVEGLKRAMQLPHAPTRRFSLHFLGLVHDLEAPSAEGAREAIVTLLQEALQDKNKKVRSWAIPALLSLKVSETRRRAEFVPLILPLLGDPTALVRQRAAYELSRRAGAVPLETAALALANEEVGKTRRSMAHLVRSIIAAQQEGAGHGG